MPTASFTHSHQGWVSGWFYHREHAFAAHGLPPDRPNGRGVSFPSGRARTRSISLAALKAPRETFMAACACPGRGPRRRRRCVVDSRRAAQLACNQGAIFGLPSSTLCCGVKSEQWDQVLGRRQSDCQSRRIAGATMIDLRIRGVITFEWKQVGPPKKLAYLRTGIFVTTRSPGTTARSWACPAAETQQADV